MEDDKESSNRGGGGYRIRENDILRNSGTTTAVDPHVNTCGTYSAKNALDSQVYDVASVDSEEYTHCLTIV